jgi:hypothetical protein
LNQFANDVDSNDFPSIRTVMMNEVRRLVKRISLVAISLIILLGGRAVHYEPLPYVSEALAARRWVVEADPVEKRLSPLGRDAAAALRPSRVPRQMLLARSAKCIGVTVTNPHSASSQPCRIIRPPEQKGANLAAGPHGFTSCR